MGLSVAASWAIIGGAIVVALTSLSADGLNAWQIYQEASDEDARLKASKARSLLSAYEVTWSDPADQLTIKVNNTGSETLDPTKTDVLVDGALKTADVSSRLVDGVSTAIWAPGQQAVFVVGNVASAPTKSVKVTAENGASAVWVV